MLARADLPDKLDTRSDLHILMNFGLEQEQIDDVARLAIGAIASDDVNTRRRQGDMSKVISRRWAQLVDDWTS
jgi:hypothetical protein